MNLIIEHARSKGRAYITPEDVADVINSFGPDKIAVGRLMASIDFLRAFGRIDPCGGVEDPTLCAFVTQYEGNDGEAPGDRTSGVNERWRVIVGGHRVWMDGTALLIVASSPDEAASHAIGVVASKGDQAVPFRLTVMDATTTPGQPLAREYDVSAHGQTRTLKLIRTFAFTPEPTPPPEAA